MLQDKDNLYFVMDYIPGGDLMSLLIKLGIFEEPLARYNIHKINMCKCMLYIHICPYIQLMQIR